MRGNVHGMAKKVIPFPAPKAPRQPDSAESQSRVTIQIGSQQYAVDISCKATELRSVARKRPAGSGGLLVETRFVRLRKAVEIGDLIAGWRVCWLGGWDKGKIYFVVMAKRTVPNGTKP
jgi:hypothetical protein